jgi:hypothetical protein
MCSQRAWKFVYKLGKQPHSLMLLGQNIFHHRTKLIPILVQGPHSCAHIRLHRLFPSSCTWIPVLQEPCRLPRDLSQHAQAFVWASASPRATNQLVDKINDCFRMLDNSYVNWRQNNLDRGDLPTPSCNSFNIHIAWVISSLIMRTTLFYR